VEITAESVAEDVIETVSPKIANSNWIGKEFETNPGNCLVMSNFLFWSARGRFFADGN
jgi:hypothetical protein